MDKSQFQALSEHVQLEAGKYGLRARMGPSVYGTLECCIFISAAPYPQPMMVAYISAAQCERLGVTVFDDFILHKALPRLKPAGRTAGTDA